MVGTDMGTGTGTEKEGQEQEEEEGWRHTAGAVALEALGEKPPPQRPRDYSTALQQTRSERLRMLIVTAYSTQGHVPPEEVDLSTLEATWEYACGDIPTEHLDECFRRALRAKRNSYPLSAIEVNMAWVDYRLELRENRIKAETMQHLRLASASALASQSGPARADERMTFTEWRRRHSAENPQHRVDQCPPCRERARTGLTPIALLTNYVSYVGHAEVPRPGYPAPPLPPPGVNGGSEYDDLPF